jgi:hypothetical protein
MPIFAKETMNINKQTTSLYYDWQARGGRFESDILHSKVETPLRLISEWRFTLL